MEPEIKRNSIIIITHLKIRRDQFISSLKLKTGLFKRCNLQTVPQRQTQFSLYSSHKRLTFRVEHTELSWTRYFGVYCTVLPVISWLAYWSFHLHSLFPHHLAPLDTFFISRLLQAPGGLYFSDLPFKRKVFLMRCKLACGWLRCCALLL